MKPGKVSPKALEVSSPAGLGLPSQAPFLSPQAQLAQARADAERQMGCSWTGPELASWPEKPQPTSENMPSLGKGEGGVGGSIKGVFPAGSSLALPPPLPLAIPSALSTFPWPCPPYLLEGGFWLPASPWTDSPDTLNFTHFV